MADLEGILSRLIRGDVRFVIVGGYAAVAHGCTLVTMDLDICCDLSWPNLDRLQKSLSDIRPVHRMTPRRRSLAFTRDSCVGLSNLYLDTEAGQLDCLGEVKGIGRYDAVKRSSEAIETPAGMCRILTLDGIIAAKQAMGRDRDREAVLQLEVIRERRQARRSARNP